MGHEQKHAGSHQALETQGTDAPQSLQRERLYSHLEVWPTEADDGLQNGERVHLLSETHEFVVMVLEVINQE